jgi:hypothetical protein
MKLQNIIWTQLVLVALGAALLFASSASAQEIENATFSDGPNVEALAQPTPAQPTIAQNPTQATLVPVQSQGTDGTTLTDSLAGGDTLVEDPTAGAWLTTALLICMALIAVYALAEAKRDDRGVRSRRRDYASPRIA